MERFNGFLGRTVLVTAFLFVFSASALAVTYTVNLNTDPVAVGANCTGPGDLDCTLRQAINAANASAGVADTILFDTTVFPPAGPLVTILLSNAGDDLDITDSLTITGPGSSVLTLDQQNTARVFDITAGDTVTISDLTIAGGAENGDGDDGGGIRNLGTLTLTLVVLTGNVTTTGEGGGLWNSGTATLTSVRVTGSSSSADGGGIHNSGTLTVRDSLIDGNSTTGGANDHGGGLYINTAGDTITVANSTITNNHSDDDGGGIYASDGTVNLNNVTISSNDADSNAGGIFDDGAGGSVINIRNTIVADNVATGTANEDVVGAFTSTAAAGGNNLIEVIGAATGFTDNVNGDDLGVDPGLGPLQYNFGPTNTRAITTSSPAYNTGNDCVVTGLAPCTANLPSPLLVNDQRGAPFLRNSGGAVDKGAFEFTPGPSAAGVSLSGRVVTGFGRGVSRVFVTLSGGPLAEPMQTFTSTFGYYTFNDVPAGQSYIISVSAKRYVFANPTLVVNVDDNLSGLDFVAEEVWFRSPK